MILRTYNGWFTAVLKMFAKILNSLPPLFFCPRLSLVGDRRSKLRTAASEPQPSTNSSRLLHTMFRSYSEHLLLLLQTKCFPGSTKHHQTSPYLYPYPFNWHLPSCVSSLHKMFTFSSQHLPPPFYKQQPPPNVHILLPCFLNLSIFEQHIFP